MGWSHEQSAKLARTTPSDAQKLAAMRAAHPRLPAAYWNFLRDVGFGCIGDGPEFFLYEGPCAPSEIFGADDLDARFVLFGDIAGGVFGAFDLDTGKIAEIEHEDLDHWTAADTFEAYVARLIADAAEGR